MASPPDPRAVAGAAAPLRVAVAGLGFGEQVHLPALAACPLTEPIALWHPRPSDWSKPAPPAACRASAISTPCWPTRASKRW